MDRRAFLKTLLAFGVDSAIPIDFARASENEIAKHWDEVINNPAVFYVNDCGTLFADNEEEYLPTSRAQMYALEIPETREKLVALLRNCSQIQSPLDSFFEELPDEPWPGRWEKWLITAEQEKFEGALASVQEWLDREPDECDWEWANRSGETSQGAALRFFRDTEEEEVLEALNVVIVEGDHPGSSYYAAELRMPIDEANAAARREGIPLLFKPLM